MGKAPYTDADWVVVCIGVTDSPKCYVLTPDEISKLANRDPEQSALVNGHTLSVDVGWFGDGNWESLRRRKQAL